MTVRRKMVGFHQDEHGHWVAELECGHTQHVRHNPPWTMHPWVITPEGRAAHLGRELICSLCDSEKGEAPSMRETPSVL